MELRIVNEFSSSVASCAAANQPAMPAIAAEMPKVRVFVRAKLTPMTAAAVSLSRTATSDRPTRLLRRLRTITYATSSRASESQNKNSERSTRLLESPVHDGGLRRMPLSVDALTV